MIRPPPGPQDDFLDALSGPALPAHLYIHVPFCRTKCSYCDFVSITDLSDTRVEPVCRGIEGEVARWAAASLPGVLETVYIGGGTPTILAARLVGLLRNVLDSLPHTPSSEVTIEANPDSWTPLLAEALAATGVTRVSLGVQSFNEHTLALLGRVHTVSEALDAARSIRATGLDLSIDLMCGIPGLSDETWVHTLEQAIATDAGHISVYPLTLEEGTPLSVACGTGLVDTPDPDRAADQMLRAEEVLSSAGLVRYEVSNYARAGMESRHNLAYWTGRPYIGVGPAAHGMLETATATAVGMIDGEQAASAARVRYGQSPDIDGWLTGADPTIELLDAAEVGREDIMLGLRLSRGVSAEAVSAAGVETAVGELVDAGLVERYTAGAGRYRTTQRGWLLGNEVFARIWEG